MGHWYKNRRQNFFFRLLFLDPLQRDSLFTILAFYYQIERIRFQVKENMLGLIRLQWWRDGIHAFGKAGQITNDPLLQALFDLVDQKRLDPELLYQILDTQEYLYNDAEDCCDLSAYISRCRSEFLPVLIAMAQICDRNLIGDSLTEKLAHFGQIELCVRHLRYASRYAGLRPRLFPLSQPSGQAALHNLENHVDLQTMTQQIIMTMTPLTEQSFPRVLAFLTDMHRYHLHYLKRFKKQSYQLFDPLYVRPAGFGLKLQITLCNILK